MSAGPCPSPAAARSFRGLRQVVRRRGPEIPASSVANAVIRFTVDGSNPTNNSPAYSEPFAIATTIQVKARVFVKGTAISDVLTGSFEISDPPGGTPSGAVVTTIAGSDFRGYKDGQGAAAQFHAPNGGFVDAGGFIYVADTFNHVIRRVSPNGSVSTLAGTGTAGKLDGPADSAQFNYPLGVFVTTAGNVFVADTENNLIRKISLVGPRTVSTVAGSGQRGYLDGPGGAAKFNFPNDLVVDAAGNIYVTEREPAGRQWPD